MDIFLIVLVIVLAGALLLIPPIIKLYNRLVRGRNKVREIWSNIEVQLNRRHELVPNLVNTVKGYATHEEGTFTKVTEARSKAVSSSSPGELGALERTLMSGIGQIYAVAEAYPELKASDNFTRLQSELSTIEDNIQQSRTEYNAIVSRFNTGVQSFPVNLIAGLLGFKSFEFFDAPDEASKAPATF